jgi:hypothetical protein
MDKDRIFYDLEASGLPCLKITDDIRMDDICLTGSGVLFDFSFYGSNAMVQYEINENNDFKFIFSEIQDGILSDSFEGFYNENEGLLKEIFIAVKDEL